MRTLLTQKQKAVLDFIQEHSREQGYPPTLREIGAYFGFRAIGTVQGYLKALTAKGYIKQGRDQARALIVKDYPGNPLHLPILGQVTAGQPAFAPENFSGTLPCGELVADPVKTFALQVSGESMIEAGILDGDFVLVHKQATARNGDIVVARVGDEVTVKRFFRDSGQRIRLAPENRKMKAMVFQPPAEVKLLGKVVGVYRRMG